MTVAPIHLRPSSYQASLNLSPLGKIPRAPERETESTRGKQWAFPLKRHLWQHCPFMVTDIPFLYLCSKAKATEWYNHAKRQIMLEETLNHGMCSE